MSPDNAADREDNDGWIHVKPKARRRGQKQRQQLSNRHHLGHHERYNESHNETGPRTEGLTSPHDIYTEYLHIRSKWEQDATYKELKCQVQDAQLPAITRAVCLGIGTFDPPDGGWESKRRTFVQLIAFLVMVEEIEQLSRTKIECVFQEPVFTTSDKAFIQSLGHQVRDSPKGFEMINSTTMLFGVHLYRPIYARALKMASPGIFVGTDLDVWDWVTMGPESELSSLENVETIRRGYKKRNFPQDMSSTAFSSTSWYWNPSTPKKDTQNPLENPTRD